MRKFDIRKMLPHISPEEPNVNSIDNLLDRHHFFQVTIDTKLRIGFFLHADSMEEPVAVDALKRELIFGEDLSLVETKASGLV